MEKHYDDDDEIITDNEQLVEWFKKGCKPPQQWRIGLENETFPFYLKSLLPVPYENKTAGQFGIRDILESLCDNLKLTPITYGDKIAGGAKADGYSITLEPGGQIELSGTPLPNLHAVASELDTYLQFLKYIKEEMGIGFLALGCRPTKRDDTRPIMPIQRYNIMTPYMRKTGTHGVAMMYHTATTQANMDYSNEQDMVVKLRISLALQPLATALFAASPILDGRITGALSTRAYIWQHTDDNRTGMLPFVFKKDFNFRDYVEWALDVPMYLLQRGAVFYDMTRGNGITFRQFMNGSLKYLYPEIQPIIKDWRTHLGTLFPDVRLRRYIEQRGADCGSRDHILALAALWTGLLYDHSVVEELKQLINDWSLENLKELRASVPFNGLQAKINKYSLRDIAKEALDMASSCLASRRIQNINGNDESIYLDILKDIVRTNVTLAEQVLDAQYNKGNPSISPIHKQFSLV